MKQTALYNAHVNQKAKMVDFAGYAMPIQYQTGIMNEHNQVRNSCGLFDVSHMGQIEIKGQGAEKFVSTITPTNFAKCNINQAKYTVLLNENGGIIDDLIITKFSDTYFSAVINAATKEKDIAHIKSKLPEGLELIELNDKSLIAIQGQKAEAILQKYVSINLSELNYMYGSPAKFSPRRRGELEGGEEMEILITRTGYTGEDGFEISVNNADAETLWNKLLENEGVKPIGLGARDSLRLEMGYPLYGHDINDKTTPVEAGLGWVVSKEHSGFIADEIILTQKQHGADRKRIGLKFLDKIIAREGAEIYKENNKIGDITSGGFSPSLQAPIALGYVTKENSEIGNKLDVKIRNKFVTAEIVKPPFLQAGTKK